MSGRRFVPEALYGWDRLTDAELLAEADRLDKVAEEAEEDWEHARDMAEEMETYMDRRTLISASQERLAIVHLHQRLANPHLVALAEYLRCSIGRAWHHAQACEA